MGINGAKSSLDNRVGHVVGASGPDIEEQEEGKYIRQYFQDDSEHLMLHTGPVQFPQVENQEAEPTHKEHYDQERVRGPSHDVKCKWKQNRHVVYFELVYFFQPTLNYCVLLVRLTGPDN